MHTDTLQVDTSVQHRGFPPGEFIDAMDAVKRSPGYVRYASTGRDSNSVGSGGTSVSASAPSSQAIC